MSTGPTGSGREWPSRVLDLVAISVAAVVLLTYGRDTAALLRYPWDWSPDEGLSLDYSRRLLEAPATLYARQVVPSPAAYTPLLPLLLAPFVGATENPLFGARLLAAGWTLGIAVATYLLVRRRARPPLALLCAALALASRDVSFWYVLVRVDGLMIALWLWAATVVLPDRLFPGADRLSWRRTAGGVLLLMASVLAKPTAALHATPLVLGWFVVDRPSAWRLTAALGGAGLATLGLLQWATGGGFLWVMGLWAVHPFQTGLASRLATAFLVTNLGFVVYLLLGFLAARRLGRRASWDGAWLLLAGGLLILPGLGKSGASWNYLLPALLAIVVLAGRFWGDVEGTPEGSRVRGQAPAILLGASLAVGSLLARPFPLPSPADEATARAFYGTVRERGRPILATRPDYAYFLVHQPVEAEGSGLPYLVAAKVPGTATLLERIRRQEYRLVVVLPHFWPNDRDFEEALVRHYEFAGICSLGYYYGRSDFVLLFPRGGGGRFAAPEGTRCRVLPPGP